MRLNNIVLTELINDRLIAYEELERAMNAKSSIEKACGKIKHYLKKIVKLNAMIVEWQQIMQSEVQSSIEELTDKLKKEENE
jgi:cell fate (sporulation/competence/biofilm development) regulator YmcA (YheA/YmcA/DUF963 family)